MAVEHYENFPVASFLLPSRLRKPVEVIYAFARSADDIADEGDFRLSKDWLPFPDILPDSIPSSKTDSLTASFSAT